MYIRVVALAYLQELSISLVIVRRNRFQETGSKVLEPVPKPGTRNCFLNIVSLTQCIICVLYESLFVNNESKKNIGLKLMRLSFHFIIHSFIHFHCTSVHKFHNAEEPEKQHDRLNRARREIIS